MTFEHEIPKGSRLYFGRSASLKRDIENRASQILSNKGYEEIVTPNFSYEQHQSIDGERELIRFSDESNATIALRADSTLDVVRLITTRLGRSTDHKKWFYIQPVFKYPANEQYQIGIEDIGSLDLGDKLQDMISIFETLDIKPTIQLSNIMIPKLIAEALGVTYKDLSSDNLEVLLNIKSDWLKELIYVQDVQGAKKILPIVPEDIKVELEKLIELCDQLQYDNLVISPLYYAKMKYYDSLFFRAFIDNNVVASGGIYKDDGVTSCGAALYTDNIIEEMI